MLRRGVLLCLLVALGMSPAVFAQEGPTGPAFCTACDGPGAISCQYCPAQCGICSSVGVIDHCHQAGVAHIIFDDGPLATTPAVLDILKAKNVKASFWLIGSIITGREYSLQRMHNEGHFIGSHSFTHKHMNSETNESLRMELDQTAQAINAATSGAVTPTHYCPPYGELNTRVLNVLKGADGGQAY